MGTHREDDKLKFIGLFIGTAVVGLVLILLAVYNASRELVIVKEIDVLHELLRARVQDMAGQRRAAGEALPRPELFADAHRLISLAEGEDPLPALPGLVEPPARAAFEASRVNEQGGYLEAGEDVVVWASVLAPGTGGVLVLARSHRPLTGSALLGIYRNRVIIPALFYVWAAVWVSFILNNLVTRLRAQKRELEHMAWYDALTGLPNRNLLFNRLDGFVEQARTGRIHLSLAVIDLDGFKQVNDTYGHHAGDELLRQVAERFRATVRKGDIVARTGGDEFVLLVDDEESPGAAEAVCSRVLAALSEPYSLPEGCIRIGASLGLARFPQDARDVAALTRKADKAMYAAKRSGGGIVCYSDRARQPAGAWR